MGMITRYKKPGGFKQLLQLIETSGKAKQEKFLTIVKEEDPKWAETIEKKMLTVDRVLSWNEQVLAEIFTRLNDITLVIFNHILNEEQWKVATKTFSHSKLRALGDKLDEKVPGTAEQTTGIINLLTEVRTMIAEGMIRLEQVDPELIIDPEIEEKLAGSGDSSSSTPQSEIHVDTSDVDRKIKESGVEGAEELKQEMTKLRQKIVKLGNENHTLRRENDELKKKISQIKRLAA